MALTETGCAPVRARGLAIGFAMLLPLGCGGGGGGGGGDGGGSYSISGAVSGLLPDGVRITATGPSGGTVTTDADGKYALTGLPNGTYTLTPSRTGATFSPAAIVVKVAGANVSNQDFDEPQPALLALGVALTPPSFSSADEVRISLVQANGNLYFSDSSDTPIKAVSPASGAVTALASTIGTPESVFLSGGKAYWVDGNRLNTSALDASGTTVLQTGKRDSISGVASDVVLDANFAYWVNTVSASDCPCSWQIVRVPLDGGAPVVLATATRPVVALVGDTDDLYWEERSLEPVAPGCDCGSAIKQVAKTGGAVRVVADHLPSYLPARFRARGWEPEGWRWAEARSTSP
jgi:hypothetical protein